MRKIVSLVMAFAFLSSMALTSGPAAAAQEVGDTVAITDIDGNEIGSVTVEDIIDPFEDMEQNPDAGLRFLSIELTIENTGDDPLPVDPGNMALVDESGIIYSDVAVDRTDNLDSIEASELESGDTLTGALEIGFPEDGEIAQMIWLVGTGQLPFLINNLDPVDTGDPVNLFTVDYAEEAVITVEDVVDGFDDVERGGDAPQGQKHVGVTVTFENISEEPITPVPDSIFLTTDDGVFWAPVLDIERSPESLDDVPDLTDEPIEPGDSVTGFIGFTVSDELAIDFVMYLPDSFRLLRIYDAGNGSTGNDNGGLGPIGRRTPTADGGNGNTNAGDECAGAAEWAELTIESLGAWGEVFTGLDFENPSPDTITAIEDGIDTIRTLAEEQVDSNPPPAAEELNDLITTAYEDSAAALKQLLEAVDTNDTELLTEALTTIGDIGDSFQTGDVADVLAEAEATCPDLEDL